MPKKKRSLIVEIKNEDILYARKQDRYACAIVRAIQRSLPEALFVRADTKEIAFSLPQDDTRYYFQTPPEVVKSVIEPFDKGKTVSERTFVLDKAWAAEPIKHNSRDDKIKTRTSNRQKKRARVRTSSGPVHTANRFLDYEADEGIA